MAHSKKVTLYQVLMNETPAPYNLESFYGFLKKEYTEELVDFWNEVKKYRGDVAPQYNINPTMPIPVVFRFMRHRRQSANSSSSSSNETENSPTQSNHSIANNNSAATPPSSAPAADTPLFTQEVLEAKVNAIIEQYVAPGAPREVNIPEKTRLQLLKNVQDKQYNPDIFRPAIQSVYELLREQCFRRWAIKQTQGTQSHAAGLQYRGSIFVAESSQGNSSVNMNLIANTKDSSKETPKENVKDITAKIEENASNKEKDISNAKVANSSMPV